MPFKKILLVRPRSRCGWGFMWSPLAINLEYIASSIIDVVSEVKIVNLEFVDEPIEKFLNEFKPDIFGVTMSATDHSSGLELCNRAKKYDSTLMTIVGGYHPTAIPDVLLGDANIDMVAVGEAEQTMRELVQRGSPEGVQGIYYKENGKIIHNDRRPVLQELDKLPFPARHLRTGNECEMWTKRGDSHRDQIHTSRGCWGRCTFCCEPSMSLSHQRFRSPENVMKEIKEIWDFHRHEPIVVIFGDPHFMGSPKNAERLSEMLIEADYDIKFTAMLRADIVAKHPDIVAKMVKAKIIGYCMGIESPAEGELKNTKKGIDNKIQREAVHTLRRNHAVAGGTFVIGLPWQREEDILMFPEYARNLGMINAAFAIATPQAATEFYNELDEHGLIVDHNWDKYDQMHLVFKHETLTQKRCEELLTHCMGRFYALDIFLDDIIALQHRDADGRKTTLKGALDHFMARLNFILQAGEQYQKEEGARMGTIFLAAQVNPHTRVRTEKLGIHNIVDLSTIASIIGKQKLQVTLKHENKSFAHYVFAIDEKGHSYMDICAKPHDDATVRIMLNMEELELVDQGLGGKIRFGAKMLKRIIRDSKFSSLAKGAVAILADQLRTSGLSNARSKIELPEDFYKDYCASDGWDREKYIAIKEKRAKNEIA